MCLFHPAQRRHKGDGEPISSGPEEAQKRKCAYFIRHRGGTKEMASLFHKAQRRHKGDGEPISSGTEEAQRRWRAYFIRHRGGTKEEVCLFHQAYRRHEGGGEPISSGTEEAQRGSVPILSGIEEAQKRKCAYFIRHRGGTKEEVYLFHQAPGPPWAGGNVDYFSEGG